MATPASQQSPRVLTADASHLGLVTALLADRGWEVHARVVRTESEARATVESAAAGATLVVLVDGSPSLSTRLRDDLARVGPVTDLRPGGPILELSLAQMRLLRALADGASLKDASAALDLSERTAHRRVAAARTTLGVPTTVEAALAVASFVDTWPIKD